ncbi:MAG TPA: YceI family protein [Chryseolinea sp.]|nr:YceI family protein [Chryseolinea sp.]
MVKGLYCCLLIFCSFHNLAQKKFSTEKGEVDFVSKADLESIRATSNKLQGVVDPSNNHFAFSLQVQTFRGFNSELQREHFNEKYMESEKYPRMAFTGKIIERLDYSIDGVYEVRAKGELDIHGQKQTRIIKSVITLEEGVLNIESTFNVPLADHNISIPRIVNQKIATEIQITVKATMLLQ